MLKNKPIRNLHQNIRRLPTYTIPEAAAFLAIRQRTLFSWYEGNEPILKASGMVRAIHLLSYLDLEEAYRLHLLRTRYDYSLQFLRRSMNNARKMFRTQHPLRRADSVLECLQDLVYQQPARGRHPRTITSLGRRPGQQLVKEVVDLFSERIVEGEFIFPWRYANIDRISRPVSLNPNIMSGRLVIIGTRIPVTMLLGRKRSGERVTEIAEDYGLDPDIVQKAIDHIGLHQKVA